MFIEMLLLSLSSSQPLSLPVFVIPPDFFENLIKSTIALFVVIDPVGNVPLFIALTEKMEKNERKAVSKIAIITAAALLVVFAIAGSEILVIFGITIYSFMVAGGVLLFIVSIELLTHGAWRFGGGTGRSAGAVWFNARILFGYITWQYKMYCTCFLFQ
jgi:protein-S-isoprenylcysteine O-methyltransferase Ste14